MNNNEALIQTFYNCFKNKDYKGMQACYDDKAIFQDPVFGKLNSNEVRAMWEMLCKSAKDFDLFFFEVKANDRSGSCKWIANYTFSKTGKKVRNEIFAIFEFENGKIIKHIDDFNFWKWSSMALGMTGRLLGWSNFLKNKVTENALKSLNIFMNKN